MSPPPTDAYRIAGVQFDPQLGEVAANLRTMLDQLREAADHGARLVIFPECALTGYCFDTRAEAEAVAEAADGPACQAFAAFCRERGVWAVYGFLEVDGANLYNAAALVGPDGLVGTYRKIHLPFMGVDRWVDPGECALAVLDAGGLKVGLHICYDGAFPETGRVLTLMGAELLVLPTNWPPKSEPAAEHMVATRAMENVVYMAAVNRVGLERGVRFIGRSSMAGTGGEILARAGIESTEILYADLDPARARQKRLIRVPGLQEIDRIADRRPEFYDRLLAPVESSSSPPAQAHARGHGALASAAAGSSSS